MTNIILTTSEELRAIISEEVSKAFPALSTPKELPDTITLDTAIQMLEEYGYPTSKAKIYKLTSSGSMPFRKYGNKLVFSRKELILWANGQTKSHQEHITSVNLTLAKSAKRKR